MMTRINFDSIIPLPDIACVKKKQELHRLCDQRPQFFGPGTQ